MASTVPLESQLPQTKLIDPPPGLPTLPTARAPGLVLPDWFAPPPGLDAPPLGLASFGPYSAKKLAGGEGSVESDTEETSVGNESSAGAGSSEHDGTEPEEIDEIATSQLKADAPCFVPGCPSPSEACGTKRTALRGGASLFVPGAAPALPFVPMSAVEESWNRYYAQQGPGFYQGAGKSKQLSKRGAARRNQPALIC